MKEQTFFDNLDVDRLMAATLSLAAELHVSRDRQRALEALLVKAGIVTSDAVESWQPTAEEQKLADADRDLMLRNVFGAMISPDKNAGSKS